ncbi:MAG: ATP-binding protein [Peptococcaceae bacterium]|nr:ATP-binding protein [Peptococcaceae bacterium]
MGYHPLDRLAASLLFNVTSRRYELNSSIILTSNKSFMEYEEQDENGALPSKGGDGS